MNRRDFLAVGSASIFGCLLTDNLLANVGKNKKSLVYVWLGGGISTQESWLPPEDIVPEAYRSVTGRIQTAIPGHFVGSTFPALAQELHNCVVVKSFSHPNPNHGSATHLLLTGRRNSDDAEGTPQLEPSVGSMVSSMFGANAANGMPSYVAIDKIQYDGGAWLGPSFNAYQNSPEAVANLDPRSDLNIKRELLSSLDKMKDHDNKGFMKVWGEYRNQSYGLIYGDSKAAFNLKQEPQSVRSIYGDSDIGRNLCLARRLVEAGTRVVNIHYGGFDLHWDIKQGMEARTRPLDKALAAFIQDIRNRGMNRDVMLICVSEFGRTKLNNGFFNGIQYSSGRDHYPLQTGLLISGGDFEMGRTFGETDKYMMTPKSNIVTPTNLMGLIFKHFGIDPNTQKIDLSGRPRYFLGEGHESIL